MRHLVLLLLSLGACGRMGFDDRSNMDPMDPGPGTPQLAPPTTGLVAHWGFDNMTATGAMSDVSADMAACTTGQCPTTTTGVTGVAAAFDGATTCLHVPSLDAFDASAYTISAWVNPTSIAGDQPVVMRYSGGCSSPSIRSHQTQLGHAAYDTADVHQYAWTDAVLTAQSWQHVAIRWDGTNQSVFVNGVCSCNNEPTLALVLAVNNEITIGCDTNDGKMFSGAIDEVRIYNRALANDEMAALVTDGGTTAPTPVSCPMACAITSDWPP